MRELSAGNTSAHVLQRALFVGTHCSCTAVAVQYTSALCRPTMAKQHALLLHICGSGQPCHMTYHDVCYFHLLQSLAVGSYQLHDGQQWRHSVASAGLYCLVPHHLRAAGHATGWWQHCTKASLFPQCHTACLIAALRCWVLAVLHCFILCSTTLLVGWQRYAAAGWQVRTAVSSL